MIFGVGKSDILCTDKSYPVWHSMLRRCYSSVYQKNKPTYAGCQVSEEWKVASNFRSWFNLKYVQGWELDKDLLGEGNLYSENTCCFLPNIINSALTLKKDNNELPYGVYFNKARNKYIAQMSYHDLLGERKTLYLLMSSDIEECANVYRIRKEQYVKELSERYKPWLSSDAYAALNNWTLPEQDYKR